MLICGALIDLLATAGSVVVAYVPSREEERPMLAVLKVAGLMAVLLVVGASLDGTGDLHARSQSGTVRPNAAW